LNGNLVSGMIGASSGKYAQLDDDRLIDELYLAAFSRSPSEKDRENSRKFLKSGPDRSKAVTDLVWAVVNTREFLFQH
ncbi:MAG TPA: hypothetical protein VFC46_05285, partial [Humisphaera sp.]|nr:hypothetical protein [Humisphaera sp.]